MQFLILGPLEVRGGAGPLPLPAGRARALLALLTLHAGAVVSSDRLIDALWGEQPPPTAATMVQGHVSRLRKVLEPARGQVDGAAILQTVPSGYRLTVEADDVDANRFKRMLDEARDAGPATRSETLGAALRLWRGSALADFIYEPFAQRAITTLEELRLVAVEERIEADLALSRHRDLVAELEGLVASQPFRERLRGHLMVALYRTGRQAAALASYQEARDALLDELGIEPGPALRDLQQAILRQDPSLDAGAATRPPPAPIPGHWLPRERRTVTLVFAELATPSTPGADPEALRRVESRALDAAFGVLRHHGARVDTLLGGMLVAAFGFPVAHEDDPVRAVRAAVELREAVGALGGEETASGVTVSVRAGIETGELILAAGDAFSPGASGPVIAAATRLQRAAAKGHVLVGAATQRLIAGAAVMQPVHDDAGDIGGPAWRILDVVAGSHAIDRSLDAAMFGRGAELTRLRTAFSATLRRGAAHRLTILGDPGIGKTRLATEFAASIGSKGRVATGRCPAYGNGITFLPLREVLFDAAGPGGWPALQELLGEQEDGTHIGAQISAAIGVSERPQRPNGLFPAVLRVFEVLAAQAPLVVVIEDLHWAEPTLLDLLDYLTERAAGRLFLMCLARPELVERHPPWGEPSPHAETVRLGPLPPEDVRLLIDDRAGTAVTAEERARIAETAQGNPLFVEQLLAALHDADLTSVPVSLQGLLAMRLDRLGPGERDLLRCASVVGADFAEDALLALLPDKARPFTGRHLETLERLRFIERTTGTAYRFEHALIHLAAYQSTARGDRARLHERFADWLDTKATEPPPELDEIAGYHLEQAVEQRRATGWADGAIAELAARAGERLAAAGERAYGRFDIAATDNLLSRARLLLSSDHPRWAHVTRLLAEAAQVLGRHGKADGLLAELLDASRGDEDPSTRRSLWLERARIQIYTSRDPIPLEAIRREAEDAARSFAAAGNDGEAAKAWFVAGYAHGKEGRVRAMAEAMSSSLDHATRSGQIREQLAARWLLVHAMLLGPTPVAACIGRCRELVTLHGGEHPGVLSDLALATAMAGGFEESRELNERARTICRERLRVRRPLMFIAQSSAVAEILAGEEADAEPHLREALHLALEMEEWEEAAMAAARLSTVLRALDLSQEAIACARQSARVAPAEGIEGRARSLAATAHVVAVGGDVQRAEGLARGAVDLVPDGMLNLRADLLVELAEALRAGEDDAPAARRALDAAAALYERKGNTAARERLLTG